MPTVLRVGPYRFFFYAGDGDEPRHVYVEREDFEAKFWLEPVRLVYNRGFSRVEVSRIQRLVAGNQPELVESWNEYFNG